MDSIISYPDRGPWGDKTYRGNCSGHVIKDLLTHYKPKMFIEVFSGGGTGRDVAKELGIRSIHLDLNTGFNALSDEIPQRSDFVFSHPPYWSIIDYNKVRGDYDPNDMSGNIPYDDFIEKLDVVNQKIYNSLERGGRHAFLMGDIRKNGVYYSVIKDMAWFGSLESHIIKAQHNCKSYGKSYGGGFIPIVHEHLLVFRKDSLWAIPVKVTRDIMQDLRIQKRSTWREIIWAFLEYSGESSIGEIEEFAKTLPRAKENQHIREKIRQTLNNGGFVKNNDLWQVA